MNKKQVERKLRAAWKCYKAGMITREEYWQRRGYIKRCEEAKCYDKAICTMSILDTTTGKTLASFRLCEHCSFQQKNALQNEKQTVLIHELEGYDE